jgi:hypothetical protein
MRRLLLTLLLLVSTASAADRSGLSYIYKRAGQSHLRTNGASIDSLVRISNRWSGEFVWVRRGGREYLIRDQSVLKAVAGTFSGMHALEPRLRAAEETRHPIEQRMEALEEQIDAIHDRLGDEEMPEATRRSLEERMREHERTMEKIEAEHRVAERAAEKLEKEMERLEEIAEREFERLVIRAIETGKAERIA